ncbi:MAG: PHB depolymerase family esterase [Thermoanaerobaculia bacterium]
MKVRKIVMGAVLAIIGLPVLLVLLAAVSIRILDQTNGTIVSSGQKREYLLYVPRSYDRAKPTPLVISMHGGALWPAAQKGISQWNRVADKHGFIVVYPSGTGVPKAWHMGEEGKGAEALEANVRFISELIDTLEAAYNIDPTRIYADGYSVGGGMAFAVSCRLSHRVAAVGAVSPAEFLPMNWCKDSRPVPMVEFDGTADRLKPYKGGRAPFGPGLFPAVRDWVASWARRNRCGPNPVESVVAKDVTRLDYTNCAEDAAVVLYTIQGGGHTWPGSKPILAWIVGPTSRSIDASSLMWEFFREHRLPKK